MYCTLFTRQGALVLKSGEAIWDAKLIKEDWPMMLQ